MKKICDNIINKINLNKKHIVLILYVLSILIYDIFFCNGKLFITGNYNFSLCRIIFYIIFILVFFKFKNKIFENLDKSFEDKFKRILILVYIPLSILAIPAFVLFSMKYGIELFAVGTITMLLSGVFLIIVSENLIKNVIVTTFTFGLIFSCTTDFNHRLDERKHFMSAFNLSFGKIDYNDEYLCDKQLLEIEQIEKFILSVEKFKGVYKPELSTDIELDVSSTPTTNSVFLYIPSAIGMAISRILQGSLLDMYIVGRIFNLITYMLLVIAIFKLLPYKKNVYYLICTMPLIILLAASYSIDALSLGLISIFIANVLRIYEKEEINIKDIILLVSSVILLLLAKSMAYIGVGLIVLILPFKKIIKQNKKHLPIFIAIAAILIIVLSILLLNINIETDTRSENTNSNGQVEFLLSNPFQIIAVFYRHVRDTILDLGWLANLNPEAFFYEYYKCVFMIMFIVFIGISVNDESKKFKIKDIIIFLITFAIVYAMTSFALYIGFTEVGGKYILGYQARYLIPILPLVFMCLNNNLIKIKINCDEKQLMSIIWGGLTIVDIIGLILL